ncbi:MAG: DEAD/DEAH box helicase [Candidatus Kariarchaeaceae archaeon]|jgi:ATP-dependent RNA helicase RhlE
MSFEDLGLDSRITRALEKIEISNPTPIQKSAIPSILKGNDVLGISPTGTGKTFAFLLPSIHWLLNAKIAHDNPSILILAPTRELVKQIQETIKFSTSETEVFSLSIIAGERETKQKRHLQNLVEIIVATPGRLIQFISDGIVNLGNIGILVIDEIDRMLDMGFQFEIREIMTSVPHKNKRQTLLFCSTLPDPVEQMAKQLQRKTHLVEIGRSISPPNISHELYEVEKAKKLDLLVDLLKKDYVESALIFTRAQDTARITTRNLLKLGLDCEEFHGGLTQRQRNKALQNFSNGEVEVMVATDIAARGIDIDDISHIISFDVPRLYDDYLHRAGRTGRINKKGTSIILASPDDFSQLEIIKKNMKSRLKVKLKLEQVKSIAKSRKTGIRKKPFVKRQIHKRPTKTIKKRKSKPFRKKPKRK